MLERLLRHLHSRAGRRALSRGCFCVFALTPGGQTCLAVKRTERAALAALDEAVATHRRAGYVLVSCGSRWASMSIYYPALDVFITLELVVEYVADARRPGLPHRVLGPLRRMPTRAAQGVDKRAATRLN
jgi:hypothetical protein